MRSAVVRRAPEAPSDEPLEGAASRWSLPSIRSRTDENSSATTTGGYRPGMSEPEHRTAVTGSTEAAPELIARGARGLLGCAVGGPLGAAAGKAT